jgi:hypothetical protein
MENEIRELIATLPEDLVGVVTELFDTKNYTEQKVSWIPTNEKDYENTQLQIYFRFSDDWKYAIKVENRYVFCNLEISDSWQAKLEVMIRK